MGLLGLKKVHKKPAGDKSYGYFQAPSGHMWGTFRMERQDGLAFDCVIPPFSLESKYDDPTNGEPILGN